MPTLAGMRRAGVTPQAIINFIEHVGVGKSQSTIQRSKFDHFLREDLNARVPRVNGVLNPLKVTITNFPEDQVEMMEFPNHPGDDSFGTREVPFTKEIYIDREDFREDPPQKFWRLAPGREVRLRYAYFMTCQEVIKDDEGSVIELRCTIDPATKGGAAPDGRRVKGTLHWVSASEGLKAEVRIYDRLFDDPYPLEVKGGRTLPSISTGILSKSSRRRWWSPALGAPSRRTVTNLNGWVIFVWTPIPVRISWCLIKPLPCGIPGPRSKRGRLSSERARGNKISPEQLHIFIAESRLPVR